jgi:c-di-GMP-binding flagellar brake protein YcgR
MNNERRRARRFPLRREARYTILEPRKRHIPVGTETLDISSGGMCLRCSESVAVGSRMDVAVSWPAVLENGCRLKLVARARVMWRSHDMIGLLIERHEFRTQGKEFSATVTAGA